MKNWQDISEGWKGFWRSEDDPPFQPGTALPETAHEVEFPNRGTMGGSGAAYFLQTELSLSRLPHPGSLWMRLPQATGPVSVWVDGNCLVRQLDPWLSPVVDLGTYARKGMSLCLSLEVEKPCARGTLPCGEGEALGLRPNVLTAPQVVSPAGSILDSIDLMPDLGTGRLRVVLHFRNQPDTTVALALRLIDPEGRRDELTRELCLTEADQVHELEFEYTEPVAWTPENPHLYQIEAVVDGCVTLRQIFGFAEPVWNEKGITLNENPLLVHGVRWDAAGPAGFLLCANPRAEFRRMRDLGFNAVFPVSTPLPEPHLLAAQHEGLLVIQNLGLGGNISGVEAIEPLARQAAIAMRRAERLPGVLGFTGADLPGVFLEAYADEWLRAVAAHRQRTLPRGIRKEFARTLVAHFGGTRLEIGTAPTQDPAIAIFAGARSPGDLEVHRFRLPAPVSIQRQSFLTRHFHQREPSNLVEQGLGDQLFWRKLHRNRTSSGRFFVARLGCPSVLDPETTLLALGDQANDQHDSLRRLATELRDEIARRGLEKIWSPSAFAAACQQVGGQATLRQADALTINPRCAGFLVNQWSDTPMHASGLVGLTGQSKPGYDWFKRWNRRTRVIAEPVLRTPYTMQTASVKVHLFNEGQPGEFDLLLRVKGNNGRIWHQETIPAHSTGGMQNIGKIEFPVGDERGNFTFDIQLSRLNREIHRTEEVFYVPPAVTLESILPKIRWLGEFPEETTRLGRPDAPIAIVGQLSSFDPRRFRDLLDEAASGRSLVLAELVPEDVRFLMRCADLPGFQEAVPGASMGGQGYHFILEHPLFARMPSGLIAGEVYADILPRWTIPVLQGAEVPAGFAELQGGSSVRWTFHGDIQILPFGKGRIVIYQYRIFRKLGRLALADALVANLVDFLRPIA